MAPTLPWFRAFARVSSLSLGLFAFSACTPNPGVTDDDDAADDDDDDANSTGVALLGGGNHTEDSASVELIADSTDGISRPRDLAFNPVSGDLWVAGKGETLVVLHDTATSDQTSTVRANPGGSTQHFYAVPSGLAFSEDNGNWASSHETELPTQGPNGTPADFMGPTLWTGDLELYDTAPGHSQHLDMLHNSPNGMGIAWEEDNTFWYFDGYHSAITRYAFNDDHGLGGADHSDAETGRYVEGEVAWYQSIPSGLAFDRDTDELFIADTGNKRIAVLDCASGTEGEQLPLNYDGGSQYRVNDASIRDFALGEDASFSRPSGIALYGDHVFITDSRNSNILALDRTTGEMVDWLELDVPEWSLMGIEFDDAGNLYVTNYTEDQILRISAPE